ncbi:MAG: homoserine dehydrogenase [Longicatena sp.]
MNIAILGFGTVGSGVVDIIEQAKTPYTEKLHVSHILIRKGKEKTHPCMCDDINVILNDDSCETVVETMGGIEPAHTYIMEALQHGKNVVTANKAVIAKYLRDFVECANAHHVKIYYEATTGGGIPWIEGLAKAMRIDEVERIHGIFNGTSNYILDHMERYGASFDEILKEAQGLGYAEADPSADIDGYDICNKLRISASLAYDFHVPDTFPVYGIRTITKQDVSYFQSLGYNVRLIAKTKRNGNHYGCVVEPILFDKTEIESNTKDNYNIITLHGTTIGDLKFYGQGAGKLPTANAIVQDIIDINEKTSHWELTFANEMKYDKTLCLRDYIVRLKSSAYAVLKECDTEEHVFEGNTYLHVKGVEVYHMHQYMKDIMAIDGDAFMASIYRGEEDYD